MSKLTAKQQAFINEYFKDHNATQAAIRAGYAGSGANVEGARLLTNANVKEEIDRIAKERLKVTESDRDRLIEEYKKIAHANVGDYATWDKQGNLTFKPSDEVDTSVISEVSETMSAKGDRSLKLKKYDKLKAMDKLGQYYQMFQPESVTGDITINVTMPEKPEG